MRALDFISLLSVCGLALADKISLSAQLGPYPVSISHREVRTNRSDPFALSTQPRRLMVTVYQPQLDILACPAEHQSNISYIPGPVADALRQYFTGPLFSPTDLDKLQLVNCTRPISSSQSSSPAPIVLFSHGLQGSRYIYASSLQAVASSGYTVIAIDHTYDAVAVLFPDGTIAPTNVSSDAAFNGNSTYANLVYGDFLQPIRIADAVSVLDAIESDQLPGLATHSKPLKTAMYGHSLGGTSSAGALVNDSRIISAGNIDGDFLGFVRNLTITKPFVMLGEERVLPSWPSFFNQNLRGWKAQANVNNTVHVSYTDSPMVVDALGRRKSLTGTQIAAICGTIDSRRNQELGWRMTVGWLNFVFRGERPKLLERISPEFPDIQLASRH